MAHGSGNEGAGCYGYGSIYSSENGNLATC